MVVSENFSAATYEAMFATESAPQYIPSLRPIVSENRLIPSGLTSTPLMHEIARAYGRHEPLICRQMLDTNWCGTLKIRIEAAETAPLSDGVATRFVGRVIDGRYFGFSWTVLIISVRF